MSEAESTRRRILVTSALPYANGPIHIGHLVEYIQTDVWVRFQRMRGTEVHFVCADDAHGTPVMLSAEREGVSPEELIERIGAEHEADFADFDISFDNYYTTHSPENRECSERIYRALREGGHVVERTIPRLYDPEREMFLPDRYVRGECPRCGAADQLGDACEVCGATYETDELRNPVSVVSGSTPERRDSEQVFVRLSDFDDVLRTWVGETFRPPGEAERRRVQPEIANKLDEWLSAGLEDWDISRNAPYFGFEIPDRPGKFFYVWLDAPIGYMASFLNLCGRVREEGGELRFEDFWAVDSEAEVYHFIGKDIAYFHTLFWPACLHGGGFRMPSAVFCHGFLTVNGGENVEAPGDLRQGPHLRGPTRLRVPPVLLRVQARGRDRRHGSEPRRLRRPGQLGPGGQGGEHRVALRPPAAPDRGAGGSPAELHDSALFERFAGGARHHR